MNWTDTDVREWLSGIRDEHRSQTAIIRDIMKHANEDGMTEGDRQIARRGLVLLSMPRLGCE